MSESEKGKSQVEMESSRVDTTVPLIFISHDHRDANLAEIFSKLLKSVSSGMLKTFVSSDKKGKDGFDFGDEWYKKLIPKLQSSSDMVCLFTQNSLERPWLLFEAGVAKGKMDIPVIGLALGIPLNRIGAGPFYQFQNMDNTEGDLTKLIKQLAKRIPPPFELEPDIVKAQIAIFKKAEGDILKTIGKISKETEEDPIAKLGEAMKTLPSRVAEKLTDITGPSRRRRIRHFHPMMFEEICHMTRNDPIIIPIMAGIFRDDAPWLYELSMEFYRVVKSGDTETIQREMKHFDNLLEFIMHSPFMEEVGGIEDKDIYMYIREFPRILERIIHKIIDEKKPTTPRRLIRKSEEP